MCTCARARVYKKDPGLGSIIIIILIQTIEGVSSVTWRKRTNSRNLAGKKYEAYPSHVPTGNARYLGHDDLTESIEIINTVRNKHTTQQNLIVL